NLLKNYEGIKQVFKLMVDSGIFKATLDINKSTNEFYSFLEGLSQHSLLLRDYYNDKLLKDLVERFVKSNYLDKDLNNLTSEIIKNLYMLKIFRSEEHTSEL